MTEIEQQRNKEARIRGAVLQELKAQFPDYARCITLLLTLQDRGYDDLNEKSIRGVIVTLADFGLVKYHPDYGMERPRLNGQGVIYLSGYGEALPGIPRD